MSLENPEGNFEFLHLPSPFAKTPIKNPLKSGLKMFFNVFAASKMVYLILKPCLAVACHQRAVAVVAVENSFRFVLI